jgi:hypothetical protein
MSTAAPLGRTSRRVLPIHVKRLAVTLAAAGLSVGATALPSSAAEPVSCVHREYSITGAKVTPKVLSVGVKKTKTVTYSTGTFVNCDITSVTGKAEDPSGTRTVQLRWTGSDLDRDYWRGNLAIKPSSLDNSDAGAWATSFTSVGTEGETVTTGDVRVVRAARMSLNATPEPVKKGKTITVRGKLERANWDRLRYYGYGQRQVDLLFRTPSGSYHKVKTVTTASDGSIKTTVKAAEDGIFAFSFAGSSTTGSARSTGDSVDVR